MMSCGHKAWKRRELSFRSAQDLVSAFVTLKDPNFGAILLDWIGRTVESNAHYRRIYCSVGRMNFWSSTTNKRLSKAPARPTMDEVAYKLAKRSKFRQE